MSATVQVNHGGLWEERTFKIKKDEPVDVYEGGKPPCKHCTPVRVVIVRDPLYKDRTYKEHISDCPYAVIATNEGGYNSTGVCLQCVVEEAAKLGLCRI